MSYEFDTQEELEEALQGEWGEEAQEEAAALLQQAELEQQSQLEAEYVASDQELEDVLVEELERAESHAGRSLTQAEVRRMMRDLPGTGEVPDLVSTYGEALKGRTGTRQGRDELAEEAAREEIDRGKEEDLAEGNDLPDLTAHSGAGS